jgi:BASS family bile acid:Na+ symporter
MTRAEYDAALRLAQSHGDGLSAELASRAFAWRHLKVIAGPRLRDAWRKVMALGPLLPLAAMAAGLLLPGVAALAFEALPVILLATLTCGLLGMPTLRLDAAVLGLALRITVCLACVAPVIGWGLAAALGADAEICALVALASAAPVGTGALGAALASGLPGGAIAGAVLVSLLAAPVLLPLVAGLVGSETGIEPWPLAISLAVLVGLPALLALALRRVPLLGTHRSRRASADIAVAALALLALARMHGVREAVTADPAGSLALLGLALLPTVAGLLAVWLVLRDGADPEVLLAGSFRNVALVWAATAHVLPPEGTLLMALTALPIFAIPALARAALVWRARAQSPQPWAGRPQSSGSMLWAWLPAALLLLATAGFVRGEILWHHTDIERDARSLLTDAVPEGRVQALTTHPYEPGPGVSGYVACGTVQRGEDAAIFAVFYVAIEELGGFVHAGGPIFEGWKERTTASSELIGAFCRHTDPSGTSMEASLTDTHASDR